MVAINISRLKTSRNLDKRGSLEKERIIRARFPPSRRGIWGRLLEKEIQDWKTIYNRGEKKRERGIKLSGPHYQSAEPNLREEKKSCAWIRPGKKKMPGGGKPFA